MSEKRRCWCGAEATRDLKGEIPLCNRHWLKQRRVQKAADPMERQQAQDKSRRRLNRKTVRVVGNLLKALSELIDAHSEAAEFDGALETVRTFRGVCDILRPIHDEAMSGMLKANTELDEVPA